MDLKTNGANNKSIVSSETFTSDQPSSLSVTPSTSGETNESSLITKKKVRRTQEIWFASTYFALGFHQGTIPILPLYLRGHNVSDFLIGVANSMAALATIFKIPIGIMSDRFDVRGYGHRRPYILIGMIATAAFYVFVGISDFVFSYSAFIALWLTLSITREVFDKPMDAYILETTPKAQTGRVQGIIKNGARSIGIIPSVVLGPFLDEQFEGGWGVYFFIIALFTFLPSLLTFSVPKPDQLSVFDWKAFHELRRPNFLAHMLYALVVMFEQSMIILALPLFLADQGIADILITAILGVNTVILLASAIAFGILIDRQRHRFATFFVIVTSVMLVAALFLFLASFAKEPGLIIGFMTICSISFGFLVGAGLTLNHSLVMINNQDPAISASVFAVFSTFVGIGQFVGSILGGAFLETIGYTYTFLILLIMVLVFNFPLTYFVLRGQNFSSAAAVEVEIVNVEDSRRSSEPILLKQESTEVAMLAAKEERSSSRSET